MNLALADVDVVFGTVEGSTLCTSSADTHVLDFGSVLLGEEKRRSLHIRNSTSEPLAVEVLGCGAPFECSGQLSVPPFSAHTFSVRLEAPLSVPQRYSCQLTVTAEGVEVPVVVSLLALVESVSISLDCGAIDFGSVLLNHERPVERVVKVRSHVSMPLLLAVDVDMGTPTAKVGLAVQPNNTTLLPGREHCLTVTLVPSAAESASAGCRLVIGVGSVSLVHHVPILYRVVVPEMEVTHDGVQLEDGGRVRVVLPDVELGQTSTGSLCIRGLGDCDVAFAATVSVYPSGQGGGDIVGVISLGASTVRVPARGVGLVQLLGRGLKQGRVEATLELSIPDCPAAHRRSFTVCLKCGDAQLELDPRGFVFPVDINRLILSRSQSSRANPALLGDVDVVARVRNTGNISAVITLPGAREGMVHARVGGPTKVVVPPARECPEGLELPLALTLPALANLRGKLTLETTAQAMPLVEVDYEVSMSMPILEVTPGFVNCDAFEGDECRVHFRIANEGAQPSRFRFERGLGQAVPATLELLADRSSQPGRQRSMRAVPFSGHGSGGSSDVTLPGHGEREFVLTVKVPTGSPSFIVEVVVVSTHEPVLNPDRSLDLDSKHSLFVYGKTGPRGVGPASADLSSAAPVVRTFPMERELAAMPVPTLQFDPAAGVLAGVAAGGQQVAAEAALATMVDPALLGTMQALASDAEHLIRALLLASRPLLPLLPTPRGLRAFRGALKHLDTWLYADRPASDSDCDEGVPTDAPSVAATVAGVGAGAPSGVVTEVGSRRPDRDGETLTMPSVLMAAARAALAIDSGLVCHGRVAVMVQLLRLFVDSCGKVERTALIRDACHLASVTEEAGAEGEHGLAALLAQFVGDHRSASAACALMVRLLPPETHAALSVFMGQGGITADHAGLLASVSRALSSLCPGLQELADFGVELCQRRVEFQPGLVCHLAKAGLQTLDTSLRRMLQQHNHAASDTCSRCVDVLFDVLDIAAVGFSRVRERMRSVRGWFETGSPSRRTSMDKFIDCAVLVLRVRRNDPRVAHIADALKKVVKALHTRKLPEAFQALIDILSLDEVDSVKRRLNAVSLATGNLFAVLVEPRTAAPIDFASYANELAEVLVPTWSSQPLCRLTHAVRHYLTAPGSVSAACTVMAAVASADVSKAITRVGEVGQLHRTPSSVLAAASALGLAVGDPAQEIARLHVAGRSDGGGMESIDLVERLSRIPHALIQGLLAGVDSMDRTALELRDAVDRSCLGDVIPALQRMIDGASMFLGLPDCAETRALCSWPVAVVLLRFGQPGTCTPAAVCAAVSLLQLCLDPMERVGPAGSSDVSGMVQLVRQPSPTGQVTVAEAASLPFGEAEADADLGGDPAVAEVAMPEPRSWFRFPGSEGGDTREAPAALAARSTPEMRDRYDRPDRGGVRGHASRPLKCETCTPAVLLALAPVCSFPTVCGPGGAPTLKDCLTGWRRRFANLMLSWTRLHFPIPTTSLGLPMTRSPCQSCAKPLCCCRVQGTHGQTRSSRCAAWSKAALLPGPEPLPVRRTGRGAGCFLSERPSCAGCLACSGACPPCCAIGLF